MTIKFLYPILFLSLLILLPSKSGNAQTLRETRAVWISTNYRLDWPPPTFNEELQKQSLVDILGDIEEKNLNTVYFQVRSNGSTLFKSSFEPFSPYISGQVDVLGSYDPLEFAIEEAHKRGLEIHAWINTMRCFNTSDLSILEHPNHVASKNPYWVYKKEEAEGYSLWINPGLPEVREYLVELIDELVRKYNVDGIQLDFIRYPQEPIDDEASYNIYGHGKNIDDWRRENINLFVEALRKKIKTTDPLIKLGATPIGIYKNIQNARGLQGYSEVFQDSRKWLTSGYIDYLTPQVYWNIKNNPEFPKLVNDWTVNSSNRSVVIGLAAYRETVAKEIDKQIDIVRSSTGDGVAFYRYKHLKELKFNSFPEKSLPFQMPWISYGSSLPSINANIRKVNYPEENLVLDWSVKQIEKDRVAYFAIYEIDKNDFDARKRLLKVTGSGINSISIPMKQIDKTSYSYSVSSLDKLWNKGEYSKIVSWNIPQLASQSNSLSKYNDPIITKLNGEFYLIINSLREDQIEILGTDDNLNSKLGMHKIFPGLNSIEITSEFLAFGEVKIQFLKSGRLMELKNN